ncbi:Predicted nuclease, contains PIN domain, potential toxin-antitoxin system component [Algoriphagus locisalis]|uniref:Predicted nuclease, contains PIN domain, potential toxin-antitoxin system component n=1 Tax=Algoriphagus locisalis TaxID=305507 RepID=A0A1I7DBP8_9BACT|nr:DUF5615 family PIN-like protein [Algoriphagus locisalis]SFU09152.1 Predicted nuclease, contains PIN domain, potential toxin-antitoxin system component [Algoriphagus locisalis]
MDLLLDANLSWRLTKKLEVHFGKCYHVDSIRLAVPARDIDIWNYALKRDLIIITNDDDFLNLATVKGFPPKVVLLKTGNQSNSYLEQLLIKHKEEIVKLSESMEYGFLEIV